MAVKRKFKKASRTGAAAFAVSLYLAGPHAVAGADAAPDDTSSGAGVSSDVSSPGQAKARGKSSAGPRAVRPGAAAADRSVDADRPAGFAPQSARLGVDGASKQASRVSGGQSDSAPQPAGAVQPNPAPAAGEVLVDVDDVAPVGDSVAADEIQVVTTTMASGPKVLAAAKAAPRSVAASSVSPPPVLTNISAQVDAVVVKVFSGLFNWVSTLPVNPVTDWLDGALLLARKSFFNQSASVNAYQSANSPLLVTGTIDVVDPEGDAWSLEVVSNPSHGTGVLGEVSQANGIGSVDYTFTPGPGYAGTDSFTVKVTPTAPVFNVTDPFGVTDSRYYTVALGDAAASGNACESCLAKDAFDTTLFLDNAGATVTVEKHGVLIPRYEATVTLSAYAANQAFAWMDIRGRTGSVSVDQMLGWEWSSYEQKASQNAVKPLLAFSYSDEGVDMAVFVDVTGVTKNVDGTYVFTGDLMADVPAQDGRVDAWDFLGIDYKSAFTRYLDASGLGDCDSGAVCSSVSAVGMLGATTLSPSSFLAAGGHDYPVPTPGEASATQLYPGSMGTALNAGLDSMIPWGTDGSFIVGESNGVIKLYSANSPTGSEPSWDMRIIKDFGWESGAYSMAVYNQVVVDANGEPIPVSLTGTVTRGSKVLTLALADAINPGSLIGQRIEGDGIAVDTVITGFVSQNAGGAVTYTVSRGIEAEGTIAVTTPHIYQQQPGLVVGLADGAVEYWNGGGCTSTPSGCAPDVPAWEGWTELVERGSLSGWLPGDYGTLNTVIALPNNRGLVAGMSTGGVYLWDSSILASDGTIVPGLEAGAGCSNSSPGNCWKELRAPLTGGPFGVNVMIASGQDGGFVAGLNDGSVQRWDGAAWTELHAAGGWAAQVNTLTPYDETTFLGSITGYPVVANNGVISVPAYASALLQDSPVLVASTSGCESSYNSGAGAGCGGYVLTVQSAKGNPIRVGQTLYGGAGLAPGTVITQQISDASGNLCAESCDEGGAGIYLVNNSQLVAPGTPMSASDGTGFIAGLSSGAVEQWQPDSTEFWELQGTGWASAVNVAIPWRDGLVVSLNNGATFYWSPSNNPTGHVHNSNALNYPGASIPSGSPQTYNWSELHGTGWGNEAISLVQVGDGFAVGLAAPNPQHNGAIEMFTGFGPGNSTSAFGYQPGVNGPELVTPSDSFTEIASQNALSGNNPNGWVQQLIPVTTTAVDGSGNLVHIQSLVAGLSNDGIYAWTGSDLDFGDGEWTTLQEPGALGKPSLDSVQLEQAWAYGSNADPDAAWGTPGGIGATYIPASGSTPASGDPIFGLTGNQAWCGTRCASYGDYVPIVDYSMFGEDGEDPSILHLGDHIRANIDLSSVTYGYIFYPNGVFDMFRPGKYSVGMVFAMQGGPSVTLNFPSYDSATEDEEVDGPRVGSYDPTPVGIFSLDVGLRAGILASLGVNEPVDRLKLAYAYYTPGLLYTWNAKSYKNNMSFSYSHFADSGYLSPSAVSQVINSGVPLTVTPYVTPYIEASYGLYTPPSTPLIGKWSIIDVGLGYQNPVSFNLTAPLNHLSDLQMSITSQGFITAGAHILPKVTSSLSWDSKLQVYSVTNEIQPPGTLPA